MILRGGDDDDDDTLEYNNGALKFLLTVTAETHSDFGRLGSDDDHEKYSSMHASKLMRLSGLPIEMRQPDVSPNVTIEIQRLRREHEG